MHSNKDERNGIAHPHGHHHQHQHHHDVDKSPYDRHDSHIWSSWSEDATDQEGHVLTLDGISQIAHHKYVAGQYTHLDNVCNPYWTQLTEQLLPTWMAPNVVTSIGGLACLASYLVTWYYLPQFEPMTIQGGSSGGGGDDDFDTVPPQLLWFNGIAVFLYFTLDCMDGKQARRTNSSSPLGQLFDHGVDCFANLSQLSVCQSFLLMGPSRGYLWSHLGLQWAFFAPQWEEYYTGILQSSYGKWLGVTEVRWIWKKRGNGVFTCGTNSCRFFQINSPITDVQIHARVTQRSIMDLLSLQYSIVSSIPDPFTDKLFNNCFPFRRCHNLPSHLPFL